MRALMTTSSLLLACGGTVDTPSMMTTGGASGESASSGASGSGGTAAGGGSMPGGSGANGAGSPAMGGSAGDTMLEDKPLLPLVAGHRSSYSFVPIDPAKPMTNTCEDPTTSVESAQGDTQIDGHTGALYRTFCTASPFLIEGEGDELVAYEIKDSTIVLPAIAYIHSPVKTGETWSSGHGDQYRWEEAIEPVIVPAGTFEHCWHRFGTDTRTTYCRGVGLVQALGEYGNYRLDLVEKNF